MFDEGQILTASSEYPAGAYATVRGMFEIKF